MRYVLLHACILLALIWDSAANAQQGQQQVQPVPLVPTPLLQSQTSTSCIVGCNTQVMNCQNSCVVVGPPAATATPSAAGSSSCALSCTNQQLLCQQGCARTPTQ